MSGSASMFEQAGGAAMDGVAVSRHYEMTEASIRLGRTQRGQMARWLALEVLLRDEVALEDDELQDGLVRLQDKIEAELRAKAGVACARPTT